MSRSLYSFVVLVTCAIMAQGCSLRFAIPRFVDYDSIGIVTRDANQLLKQYPGAKDEIESRLRMGLQDRGFHVVERDRMQELFDELNLSDQGITTSDAIELGKAASAQALLFADVSSVDVRKTWLSQLGEDLRAKFSGSTSSEVPDPGASYQATVKILVRLVDVEEMQSDWGGDAKRTVLVFSADDLGDAHVKAADVIAAFLPWKKIK